MKTLKVISWRALLVGTVVAVAAAGITAFRNQNQGYDYEASIAKLRRIGQALQLYRQEWGVKPMEERRTYSDAGLPPSLAVLYSPAYGSKPWHIEKGYFKVAAPQKPFDKAAMHFVPLFLTEEFQRRGYPERYVEALRGRGEMLPVFADLNANSVAEYAGNRNLRAVVLRLNGAVEVVEYSSTDQWDLWNR
ncbi:MAG: hypothetical protein AB1725_00625 [Armatimonadota bacterium]